MRAIDKKDVAGMEKLKDRGVYFFDRAPNYSITELVDFGPRMWVDGDYFRPQPVVPNSAPRKFGRIA